MITITAREDRLLEKRSLPFLAVSLLLLARSPPFPPSPLPSHHLCPSFVRVSASLGLGVMTAAPRCVRKQECHVLTGVGGMLTGQTEGTDGSVTCPRSSGVPLLGSLDLKSNTFFFLPFPFPSCSFSFFSGSPPPSFHPPTFHSFTSPMSLSLPPLSASHSVLGSPAHCFYHPFPKSPAHAAAYLCLNTLAPNPLI